MRLRACYEREVKRLCADVEAFPWENREGYARWLLNTWEYVKHTTRLTALAAARVPIGAEELHSRLMTHGGEEMAHEKLLVADLAALGYAMDENKIVPTTTALAQCLYYQIEYLSPFALFGRVLPLEGVSAHASHRVRARVVAAHGPNVDRFLQVHGDADPTHVEEAFGVLAKIGPHDGEIIEKGILLTCSLYRSMLDAIARDVSA
jgi:hypothetical protein